jgi:phosphatidylglycerol---prolipoprotein diacylglyceryl transferase
MRQELFRIPFIDHPVYGYGLMLVVGFLLGAQLAKYLARRCGYNGDHFVNGCLLGLLAGVVGARLSHIIESLAGGGTEFANNGRSAWDNFLSMLNVSSGGLTFYGGFLLATPVLILYAKWKRIPVLRGMDIIAPSLMIGLAFGRIGCYLNGCCYGEECQLPWGAAFPFGSNAFVEQYEKGELPVITDDEFKAGKFGVPESLTNPNYQLPRRANDPAAPALPKLLTKEEVRKAPALEALSKGVRAKPVHPTEIYSAFNAFFIAGVVLVYFSLTPAPGRVFALMMILKGLSRYVMEMIRVEPAVWGPLSFSMVVSLGLVVGGIVMWLACGWARHSSSTGSAVAVAPV